MILLIFSALLGLRCQTVIERADQEGVYLNDYCPKTPNCAEGIHVMCMYYNPNRVSHPRCRNFFNISTSPEIADLLLDLVNEIRGQIAMGKETGLNDMKLPRGYGIFKLKWDNELATFAQVLANNCIFTKDLCRATKRFPDPGQLVGIVRFTMDDWIPSMHRHLFKDQKGFSSDKLEYAVKETVNSWYKPKELITPELLEKPDLFTIPTGLGQIYLQLIDGKATHMGCGISSYVALRTKKEVNNVIHVVCNFSSQPKNKAVIYNTKKSNHTERDCPDDYAHCEERYQSKCGCPEDMAEDDLCLCTDPINYRDTPSCGKDQNCKPAIVLLPIFTVEDAPQNFSALMMGMSNELVPDSHEMRRFTSNEWEQQITLNQIRRDNDLDHSRKKYSHKSNSFHHSEEPNHYIVNSLEPPYSKKHVVQLKHDTSTRRRQDRDSKYHAYRRNRQSLFSRAKKINVHKPLKTVVIKDVPPRRDFSDAKEALNNYLNKKRQKELLDDGVQTALLDEHIDKHNSDSDRLEIKSTKQQNPTLKLNKSFFKNPGLQQHTKNKYGSHYFNFDVNNKSRNEVDAKYAFGESDKKLMSLLDNLENEAKRVDLDGNDKEIFNAKLRKICAIVRKPNKLKVQSDIDGFMLSDTNKYYEDDDFYFSDNRKSIYVRPLTRDQITLRPILHSGNEMDYPTRNTFNDFDEFRRKLFKNYHQNANRYRNDKNERVKKLHKYVDLYGVDDDKDVKSLPYKLEIGDNDIKHNVKPQSYEPKRYRPDDKKNVNFNNVRGRNRYDQDIFSDYDDDKFIHHHINNHLVGQNYLKYYPEDPLGAERRKFYQDKLDNIEKEYSNKIIKSNHNPDAVLRRRPIRRQLTRRSN